ncbi:MAG: TIGR02530 family flagellar biosynthesis protein [Oscillospiraceae bacterium]
MEINNTTRLGGITGANTVNKNSVNVAARRISDGADFKALLNKQLNVKNQLQFSKHAEERIAQRGIEITPNLLNQLGDAVSKARAKGAKDIVIINQTNSNAFIVNIPNNVVVTTMVGSEMKNNVFTNIDSAVLI